MNKTLECAIEILCSVCIMIIFSWFVYNRIMHMHNWERSDNPNSNGYYWNPVIRPYVGAFHMGILLFLVLFYTISFFRFFVNIDNACGANLYG